MKHLLLSLIALTVLTTDAQVKIGKSPCGALRMACRKAGYKPEKADNKKDTWNDCALVILTGGIVPGVVVSDDTIKGCKKDYSTFSWK